MDKTRALEVGDKILGIGEDPFQITPVDEDINKSIERIIGSEGTTVYLKVQEIQR